MQNKYYHDDFCMFPGSYFGEEMFILNNPRSSRTFIALKDVTVCVIDKELFTSEEIFKPAVDQLTCDVTARLKVPPLPPPALTLPHKGITFCTISICFARSLSDLLIHYSLQHRRILYGTHRETSHAHPPADAKDFDAC